MEGLANGDVKLIANNKGNDLAPAAIAMLPEVQDVIDALGKLGFEIYGMSGSGSSCYGLTLNSKKIKEAEKFFAIWDCDVFPCKTLK